MKKDETRFTVKFNPANPRHRDAIRILNTAGGRVAGLIADALCFYSHHGTTSTADLGVAPARPQHKATMVAPEQSEVPDASSPTLEIADTALGTDQPTEDDLWQTINESLESFFG